MKKEETASITGWVHRKRNMGGACFIIIRNGNMRRQIVLKRVSDDDKKFISDLSIESSVRVTGRVVEDKRAPGGSELHVDMGDVKVYQISHPITQLNPDSKQFNLFQNRHLVLRNDKLSSVMRLRSDLDDFIRFHMRQKGCVSVTPPTLTSQSVEGGATLFPLKFYDDTAYMTQSSQLYLESVIASLGAVYCIMPSYRAEKSTTPRHLSEFTHFEAEFPFIDLDDLIDIIEEIIMKIRMYIGSKSYDLSESFMAYDPSRKIDRMTYKEFIDAVNAMGLKNPMTKKKYMYGEDVTAAVERKFIDKYNKPLFVTRFPTSMKAFYMQPCDDNKDETESLDLLMPGVGEIVGGSMRIWDHDLLIDKMKEHGLSTDDYSWYIDQRKYGSVPHGGFGLGIERLIMWMTNQPHVKDCCLYPRYVGRLNP